MGKKTASSKKNIKKINQKKNTVKNKSVFIVISKTSTLPSNVIKMWTKEPYAHTSLALDIELNEMYSFARKKLKNPFDCGFISEDITKGVFGRDVDTVCQVARLRLTANQHRKLLKILDKFKKEKNLYHYNYMGIFGVMFNRAVERKYNYFCSQFVYSVLQKSGVRMFDKKPGLVRPEDFRVWDELEIIYQGKLNQYRKYLSENYVRDDRTGDYIENPKMEAAATVM
ncbi:MAG: hypothetical protein ACI4D8_00090 [Wujia sp.]